MKTERLIWDKKEFTTYSALKKYLDSIKTKLIGNTIRGIFVPIDYYDELHGTDFKGFDILNEYSNASIDWISLEPAIIKIGKHNLFFNTFSGSYFEISLDTKF
jgi:hypothetical protein